MSDFATLVLFDGQSLAFDWALCGPDLESDDGLRSAVVISLFCDRLAAADDVLPDGSGDRRGWWADVPPDGADDAKPDYIGSRLWLLRRAKATDRTARLAENYAREALKWLIDDGVAAAVSCRASWLSRDELQLAIALSQTDTQGNAANRSFSFSWNVTLGGNPSGACVAVASTAPPVLITESGQTILTEAGQPLL
jgi:phage gp46-like protein